MLCFIAAFAMFHVLVPTRHFFLYQGNPSWSEEGHFSAWHMMLRSKRGATTMLRITEENGPPPYFWDPVHDVGLKRRQYKKVNRGPHAALIYVRHIAKLYEAAGKPLKVSPRGFEFG